MNHKYGEFSKDQFQSFKKRMHGWTHFMLVYVEEQPSILDNYLDKIQRKMEGLNSLLEYPVQVVEIMDLIESARIEFHKTPFNHRAYRKIVMDIHELIDRLPEE